ncbi:hypothetical protein [Enterococcus gilvus]|uniref:Uncharacterized protein n=1 Tax=Enterococcus gilvus ATCC BAA-350 TaxID=1158614 RepID=R2XV59_9ENTE|nr:hypothetical protein [Enterococcus gilvus]EOI58844.1 hypothetical protein UKC_00029 [Enterococcus gilvus ATCC BAA-350]EOW79279.1 hypothetical protein I592_03418 [Enterococcus gilvus ATCC BAA-350]OJG40521.1 hypothetical protein RV02_GL002022 [Enterococcus gilvus]
MAQAYVDEPYYTDKFEGTSVNDGEFSRFSKRATEIVDALTEYQIPKIGLDKFSDGVQELIKKACCAQIEYYQIEGIDVDITGTPKSSLGYSIGDYSRSASGVSTGRQAGRVAPSCLMFLEGTGLLRKRSVRIGVV